MKEKKMKGDLDKDGKMSGYEKARQRAIEKNMNKKGAKKMAGGGMMTPMKKMGMGGDMMKPMKKMGKGGNMMKTYAYGSTVRKPMAMGGMSAPMQPRTQQGMGMQNMMGGGMMKKMRYGGSMKKKS